jgi:hypothetical protein
MTMPSLIFYFAPGSSSMAAHIALHEVGAAFEARPVSLARKQTPRRRVHRDQPRRSGTRARH